MSSARLFISYSRRDQDAVYPFADALMQAGIDIWLDRQDIDPLDDFPTRIRDGLARCHALLAWYSPEYAQSSYCQKELIAAWIAAQRQTRDVLSRILVVNPQEDVAHIALGDLKQQNYLAAPKNDAECGCCIQSIRHKLIGLTETFAAVREFTAPQWYPVLQLGSVRFVGRLAELWRVHEALNPVGISQAEYSGTLAQLVGMGGVGKSLLAVEYAKRFGAAYPGGIHWLRAYGFDPRQALDAQARERERERQIEELAAGHGVSRAEKSFSEVEYELRRVLQSDAAYLWIVDDLPPGMDQGRDMPGWYAPSPNGRTLVTTRSRDYEGLAATIEVGVLDPEPAFRLLTQARKPRTFQEKTEARELAEALGGHPLALDVAGRFLLETKTFAALRGELAQAQRDPLGEFAAALNGQLPGGHEKSVVATLVQSVRLLEPEGLSLLRLAAELQGAAPLPARLAEKIFGRAFRLQPPAAEDYRARGMNQLQAQSLGTLSFGGAGGDALAVHALVRYAMLHGDPAGPQASPLRASLREAAVPVLCELLQSVADIRTHASLALEIVHAHSLVTPVPRTVDEALLANLLATYENARGDTRTATALAQSALPILQQSRGADDPDALTTRANIISFTHRSDDFRRPREALASFQTLLADEVRVLGGTHPETLRTRGNIAYCTGRAGDPVKALRLSRALLADREALQKKDDPDLLLARHNVAYWTWQAGDPGTALCLFRELLPEREQVLGKDHPKVLRERAIIAALMWKLEDAKGAVRLFREVLAGQEVVLSPDHPDTLETRFNLALSVRDAGDLQECHRLLKALLPDVERVFGEDDSRTVVTRRALQDIEAAAR